MTIRQKKSIFITRIKQIYDFFPFRLFIDYLRYNRLLVLSWLLPFLFVTTNFGQKFGIPNLFMNPEYMGKVGGMAFLFEGIATGAFIMAFHIASYVVIAHRYPFIVRFSKPFYIFSLNNTLIPLVYLSTFIIESAHDQSIYELNSNSQIIFNLLIYIVGVVFFIYFSFSFFFVIARLIPNGFHYLRDNSKLNHLNIIKRFIKYDEDKKLKESPINDNDTSKVNFYLLTFKKIKRTGRFSHFEKKKFAKTFMYQHINAFAYMIFVLTLILIRGFIKDSPIYIIPAAASLFTLFTVGILIVSMFYITLRAWTMPLGLVLLIIYSYTLPFKTVLNYHNSAYGLNYKNSKSHPIDVYSHGNFKADSLNTIHILERWKQKNSTKTFGQKPKMVIVCTSGGGLKMAVWTNLILSYADSLTDGKLLAHTQLITGASGGMLGAAYVRENYLRHQQRNFNLYAKENSKKLAKDLLNPIFFYFAMHDWFFRLERFRYNNHLYYVDRAYALEQTLMQNIGPIFNKPIKAYSDYESKAMIPMMFITPSIENVGSRMIISSTPVSYMVKSSRNANIRNIEFTHNYKEFGAEDLRFSTAIRMNATFPYVSPDVALPGKPTLYLIDAGLNDNYGIFSAYDFIVEFKEWIRQNTSGLILLKLDEQKDVEYKYLSNPSQSILRPIGSIFIDWANIQEDSEGSLIESLENEMGQDFHFYTLSFNGNEHEIPLSWHLSKSEKQILYKSVYSKENQYKIQEIRMLLN